MPRSAFGVKVIFVQGIRLPNSPTASGWPKLPVAPPREGPPFARHHFSLEKRRVFAMKKIVITGASRGLGRALALEFARGGHAVAGCARSQAALDKLAAKTGPQGRFAVVDVCDPQSVEHWASELRDQWGVPDLLINNAAVINTNGPLWEAAVDEFSRVIDVNIKGVFHSIRAFAPAMIARRSGVIVNLSSGWGRSTSPDVAVYCASKWAIEGLTRALAQELPAGMAAVPLNPGIIDTDMLRSCFGSNASAYPSPQAWGISAARFLLGLEERHNGQPLTVPSAVE